MPHRPCVLCTGLLALAAFAQDPRAGAGQDEPVCETAAAHELTAEQDHARLMCVLGIRSLRRGADGDPGSPNAANYDEALANDELDSLPEQLAAFSGGDPPWQEQVLDRGWAYASFETTDLQADNGDGLQRGIIGVGNGGDFGRFH